MLEFAGRRLHQPLCDWAFMLTAATLAFLTYFAVFRMSGDSTAFEDALSSLRNLVPLIAVTVAGRALLFRWALRFTGLVQLGCHLVLAPAFALTWYWLLMIVMGLANGEGFTRFQVRPVFDDPAFSWQVLQGMTVYAALAAVTLLRAGPRPVSMPPDEQEIGQEDERPSLERYLIRSGDDIFPVDVEDIISIEGADDYAEVVSLSGRHLLRATLRELEQASIRSASCACTARASSTCGDLSALSQQVADVSPSTWKVASQSRQAAQAEGSSGSGPSNHFRVPVHRAGRPFAGFSSTPPGVALLGSNAVVWRVQWVA